MREAVQALATEPRPQPLEPCAVAARGAPARALAHRLLRMTDEALAALSGVGGEAVLVVLGPSAQLPWVDGVLYLGREPDAPSLLWPTHSRPRLHASLVAEALLRKVAPGTGPWAVLPGDGKLVPLVNARPLHRAQLEKWLAGQSG